MKLNIIGWDNNIKNNQRKFDSNALFLPKCRVSFDFNRKNFAYKFRNIIFIIDIMQQVFLNYYSVSIQIV